MKVLWICQLPLEVGREICPDVASCYPTPSVSWIVAHLPAPNLVELHIACPVFGLKRRITAKYRGATFHLFPHRRLEVAFLYLRWLPELIRITRTVIPDIVHGWGTESGYGLSALRVPNVPHVLSVQGLIRDYCKLEESLTLVQRIILWYERLTISKTELVVCESRWSQHLVGEYFGRCASVVPHPLQESLLQEPLNLDKENKVVFVGTLCARKGVFDALEAFLAISSVDWQFDIIGVGELERDLKNRVQSIGKSNVSFLGSLDVASITKVLSAAKIFLLPTYADTGPTALKEAIAMGVWPICYDNSGPRELLSQYSVGDLVPTGDRIALTQTLSNAITRFEQTPLTCTSISAEQIRFDLSRDQVWKRLADLYVGLLD